MHDFDPLCFQIAIELIRRQYPGRVNTKQAFRRANAGPQHERRARPNSRRANAEHGEPMLSTVITDQVETLTGDDLQFRQPGAAVQRDPVPLAQHDDEDVPKSPAQPSAKHPVTVIVENDQRVDRRAHHWKVGVPSFPRACFKRTRSRTVAERRPPSARRSGTKGSV